MRTLPRVFLRLFVCGAGLWLCAGRQAAAQSDPSSILAQLNSLMQQIQSAQDPCPYMPRFRSLINQLARTNADVYNAMKPTLDAFNSTDDGCSSNGSAGGSGSGGANGSGGSANGSGIGQSNSGNGSSAGSAGGGTNRAGGADAAVFDNKIHPYCLMHDGGITNASPEDADYVIRRCTESNGAAQCNYYEELGSVNGKQERWLTTQAVCPSTGRFIGGTAQSGDTSVTNVYLCTPGTPITASVTQGKGSDGTAGPKFKGSLGGDCTPGTPSFLAPSPRTKPSRKS